MYNLSYDAAVDYGLQIYLKSKGADTAFVQNEILPLLINELSLKVHAGNFDKEFLKLSNAVHVLSGGRDALSDSIDTVVETALDDESGIIVA